MQSEFDDERGDYGAPASDDIRRRVRAASAGTGEGGGLELIGGVLFLVGCLPAAAVAKALMDGTDLSAEGLGGTAALASMVSAWVGPWPALAIAASVAIIGALMVIGSLRTEPLRYVAGAAVSGFGLAAIASALSPGAGGQLGEGTGGAITQALGGAWAGILLGLAVIAASVWFAFLMKPAVQDGESFDAPFDDDDFGPVQDDADGFGMGSALVGAVTGAVAGAKSLAGRVKRSAPRHTEDEFGAEGTGLGRGGQRRRKIQTKSKRRANPVTLGDALASGGSEGVSHDEAAALAPDEKALAYMEDVWRRASDSYQQTQPVPPSPYPEDVRLRGEIPDGAAPLTAAETKQRDEAAAEAAAKAPSGPPSHVHPLTAAPAYSAPVPIPSPSAPDIAPFDFQDEMSAPMPLVDTPAKHSNTPSPHAHPLAGASDPFSAPFGDAGSQGTGANPGLSQVEADALESAVRREGATTVGPTEFPEGVKPLMPSVPEAPVPASPTNTGANTGAAHPMASSVEEVLADPAEIARAGDVSAQAMQAGAMPAEVSLPPAPAWETGYAEDEVDLEEPFQEPSPADLALAELQPSELEDIPEVDPTGHWPRREDDLEDELEVEAQEELESVVSGGSAVEAEPEESEEVAESTPVVEPPVEPESLFFPEAAPLPVAAKDLTSDVIEDIIPSPAPSAALEVELEGEADEMLEEEILEAEFEEDEDEEEPEAELETEELAEDSEEELEDDEEEAAELDEEEEEDVEWVDEDGNPIDPEDLGDEYELVEVGEDEEEDSEDDEEEAAELEEGEEEEYEYVDEDGNPIDPEDVDEEWEVVEDDEEDDESEEAAELEDEEDSEEPEEPEENAAPAAESESSEDEGEWEEDWEDPEENVGEAEAEIATPKAEEEDEDEPGASDGADSDAEATVILEPKAPPEAPKADVEALAEALTESLSGTEDPAPSAPSVPVVASSDGQRLLAAGRVVVQEGRVAVSLLQREFDMEFDEACAVLDELQQEGLIGPYKGGKARDILLTPEEWEGRFAHS